MKKILLLLFSASFAGMLNAQVPYSSGYPELDEWTERCLNARGDAMGYPCNYDGRLSEFYKWYTGNGLENMLVNNAGDPFDASGSLNLSSAKFEKEVIEYFAPLYGFDNDNLWGLVTMSGTDGNNHGLYFGVNYLMGKTGKMPIVYVSDEAHYSNYRLCDLQNLDVRLIKSNAMGQMIPDSLEAVLDTSRPCLMIFAMTTLGCMSFASLTQRWFIARTNAFESLILAFATVTLLYPYLITGFFLPYEMRFVGYAIGLGALVLLGVIQRLRTGGASSATAAA